MKNLERLFYILIIIFFGNMDVIAQNHSLQMYVDSIFFNIYSGKPDSLVEPFISQYVPKIKALYNTNSSGRWSAKPPIDYKSTQECIHSLIFTNHPLLRFEKRYSEGRLDILTREAEQTVITIRDIQVWFTFNSEMEAIATYEDFKKKFIPISTEHNFSENEYKREADFIDKESLGYPSSVQIILTKDNLYSSKYKILCRAGIYNFE